MSIKTISDIVAKQLCSGCGACAYISPKSLEMINDYDFGKRPRLITDRLSNQEITETLAVCPGISLKQETNQSDSQQILDLASAWGSIYAVWEGYASDEIIRFSGSSGGVATALSLYCLEKAKMYGVLHTAVNPDIPYENKTVLSKNREELLQATGSRYAPASPCDGLKQIEEARNPCVFVGKPCDVAAVQKARKIRPQLNCNIGVTISFFCAGVPSTTGTLELLKKLGIENPNTVTNLRYRGNGWPGFFTAEYESNDKTHIAQMSYEESWGFLQKYRQWRCYICPDHTGEFADIAVGDPWYRQIQKGEKGSSLIIARTLLGKQIIEEAAKVGYIVLEKNDSQLLPKSQPNLLKARGSLWGRLLALKAMGAASPNYEGFELFQFWLSELTFKEKVQSIFGTIKRIFTKGLL
jgi:coenzyme F420 hydrogenase subunit beta